MPDFINAYFDAPNGLGRLMAHARLLNRLQSAYADAVPAYLGQASRVANYKQGIVVIHTESGGVAVKLKQLSPSLTDVFLGIGVECSGIQVRVQPGPEAPEERPRPQRALTSGARQGLGELASGMADTPLRRALESLLKHSA
ncbi:hypothetical protein OTERR_25180 [Oryzomicrobium terrae]|uniref:DUF721 domain-containing protein n=1 Tax=Oryzomicrobium terrae TaxID=1735038 RepID=A0A5C1EBD6_9RHOO|nr:DciA family protein [Oryzomicrobium terrae]QEL65994.1 hypothetical protein OTERR_25180 [Oryzomicrobium terrae]